MDTGNNTGQTCRLVFAVEMASGTTTFYGGMETLGRLMVIYEECGYSCTPYVYEDETDEEFNFGMSSFRVNERPAEFTTLNSMLAMPSGVPIKVWSWGLVTDYNLPDWEYENIDRDAGARDFLAMVDNEEDTVTIFGQPELLKTAVDLSRRHRTTLQNMSRKNDEYVSITLAYSECSDVIQSLTDLGYDQFWREVPEYMDSEDDITLEW